MDSQLLPVLMQFLKNDRGFALQRGCVKHEGNLYASGGHLCRKFRFSGHRLSVNQDCFSGFCIHQRADDLILLALL